MHAGARVAVSDWRTKTMRQALARAAVSAAAAVLKLTPTVTGGIVGKCGRSYATSRTPTPCSDDLN